MHSRFLAVFTRLKKQSFDSTLELDCQDDILLKTFPAPERIDSEALLNPESVPGGCFGV